MRFVVLRHEPPPGDPTAVLHWDLMLEQAHDLRTWRLDRWPLDEHPTVALPLANHRLAYLDYEGPISGGRGSVMRVAEGTYEIILTDDRDRFCVRLQNGSEINQLTFSVGNDGATLVACTRS